MPHIEIMTAATVIGALAVFIMLIAIYIAHDKGLI